MKIYYSKYFNLLQKDLLLSKNTIFLSLYFLAVILILPAFTGASMADNMLNLITTLTLLEIIIFGNNQVLISEKCKGTELIITTSYTRKDIINSKYLFFYILSLGNLVIGLTAMAILYPNINMNFFVILEYLLLISLGIGVSLPLTFKMNSNLSYTLLSFIFTFPVLTLVNIIEYINEMLSPAISCALLSLISIIVSFISKKVSEKIYLKKDL